MTTIPTPCYHCALPVPPGSRFTAVILGETRERLRQHQLPGVEVRVGAGDQARTVHLREHVGEGVPDREWQLAR